MADPVYHEQTKAQQLADERSDAARDEKEYLTALNEDINEWINDLLGLDLLPDTLLTSLEDGVIVNELAHYIHQVGDEYFKTHTGITGKAKKLPSKRPKYRQNASSNSFFARDNVSNFITWCKQLGVPEVMMFETEDLVSQKNSKSVLLCLLEISRIAVMYGVTPSAIVALENEIDKESNRSDSSNDANTSSSTTIASQADIYQVDTEIESKIPCLKSNEVASDQSLPQKTLKDKSSTPMLKDKKKKKRVSADVHATSEVDNMVRQVVSECTCRHKFNLRRISEGKYRVGEEGSIIFVRILRKHVMVRVGGGWDTLENYVNKHDPCRNSGTGSISSSDNMKSGSKKGSTTSLSSNNLNRIEFSTQTKTATTQQAKDVLTPVTNNENLTSVSVNSSPKKSRSSRLRSSSLTFSGEHVNRSLVEKLIPISPDSHKVTTHASISKIPKPPGDTTKSDTSKNETPAAPHGTSSKRRTSNIPVRT